MWRQCIAVVSMAALAAAAQTRSVTNTFSGRVQDQSGAPIPGAQVDLYSGKQGWHSTTAPDGAFSFPALQPGTYEMEVVRPGFRKVLREIAIGSSDSEPMTIRMNIEAAGLCEEWPSRRTYTNAPAGSGISGAVTANENGSTPFLPGVTLTFRSAADNKRTAVRTGKQGEFHVELEPGRYSLQATHPDYSDVLLKDIRVRNGQTLRIEFSMISAGSILTCQ